MYMQTLNKRVRQELHNAAESRKPYRPSPDAPINLRQKLITDYKIHPTSQFQVLQDALENTAVAEQGKKSTAPHQQSHLQLYYYQEQRWIY